MDVTEICIFWGDWQINRWWSCMTKAEWSGWMQAVGAFAALLIAIWVSRIPAREEKRNTVVAARHFVKCLANSISGASIGLQDKNDAVVMMSAVGLKTAINAIDRIRHELLPSSAMDSLADLKAIASQIEFSFRRFEMILLQEVDDKEKNNKIKLIEECQKDLSGLLKVCAMYVPRNSKPLFEKINGVKSESIDFNLMHDNMIKQFGHVKKIADSIKNDAANQSAGN